MTKLVGRCACGHSGDGENTQHDKEGDDEIYEEGHGRCMVKGCNRKKFT